jgi:hypothetical protein
VSGQALEYKQQNRPPYHHRTNGGAGGSRPLNAINQLVISTKEGIFKAITKMVGSNITDAILRMADGSNHKTINDSPF